jgi:ATP:cob(I)alamin adenosyltransferase
MKPPPHLGLARAQCTAPQTPPILLEAQRDLYKLMAEVAATPENAKQFHFIDEARVKWLEEQTDSLSAIVEMPKEFILPGDTLGGAALSMARAIIRRAERRVVALFDEEEVINPDLQRYLNRFPHYALCWNCSKTRTRARKLHWQNHRKNMTGTFINVAAVLIGGAIGLIFGARIPERFKSTVIAGMGLFTAAWGWACS